MSKKNIGSTIGVLAAVTIGASAYASTINNLDKEVDRKRTEQSFFVPIEEIKENDYDLSINKYKEVIYEKIEYRPSKEILGDIASLNQEIDKCIKELQSLLED